MNSNDEKIYNFYCENVFYRNWDCVVFLKEEDYCFIIFIVQMTVYAILHVVGLVFEFYKF